MPNLQQIIDRAEQLASGIATGGAGSPVLDDTITAQTIYPHAVRNVLNRLARSGEDLHDLAQIHTIAIAAGVGALPDTILKDTLESAMFPARFFVSHLPFQDYQRYKFTAQLDYFTTNGSSIYFKAAGVSSFTGNLELSAPTIPAFPDDIEDDVLLSAKVVEEVILTIASVLRGEQSLAGLNN